MATLYCDANLTTGLNNGTSWENAYQGASGLNTALNAAVTGSVIHVKDGTYSKLSRSSNLSLEIRSVNGPSKTFIDGENNGRCCYFSSASSASTSTYNTKVFGFTLKNGYMSGTADSVNSRGAVSSGGYFEDCIITNNYGYRSLIWTAKLVRCIVTENTCAYQGLMHDSSTENVIITNNTFGTGGSVAGGLMIHGGTGQSNINTAVYGNKYNTTTASIWCVGYANLYNCTVCESAPNNQLVLYYDDQYAAKTVRNSLFASNNRPVSSGSDAGTCRVRSTLNYTTVYNCVAPILDEVGNKSNCKVASVPLSSDCHLLATSTDAIGAGDASYLRTTTDLDGVTWATPPSVGCYEYVTPTHSGLPMALAPFGGGGMPLPYDAEIEYIGLTGTQYIDLGVVFQKDYVTLDSMVWLDAHTYDNTPALIGGAWPLPSESSRSWHRYWVCSFPSLTAPYTINTAVGAYNNISTLKVSANQWHRFEIDYRSGSQVTKVDGAVFVSGSYAFDRYINPTEHLLYGRHSEWWGATSTAIYGRLGSAKINVDGTSFDFIPVRIGSVGYMYDSVSGQLFGNAGTGSFVLGPDVN